MFFADSAVLSKKWEVINEMEELQSCLNRCENLSDQCSKSCNAKYIKYVDDGT